MGGLSRGQLTARTDRGFLFGSIVRSRAGVARRTPRQT